MAADARGRAAECVENCSHATGNNGTEYGACIACVTDALAQETERCILVIRETVGDTVPTELLVAKIRGTRP
jgi:hypothetical protein